MPEVGNKRPIAVDEHGIVKQAKSGTKIRILIKGVYTGALIGKGGENFKGLRERYDVKITGLSSRADERVLQLDGDRNECFSIIKEILPSCAESPFQSQAQRLPMELNILVNSSQVGGVIGKAGAKLKEIRDNCGGGIKVYPDPLPNSTERVVAMGGEDEDVVLSILELVLSAVDNAPLSTPTVYYDPSNSNININNFSTNNVTQTNAGSVDVAQVLISRQELKQRNPPSVLSDFGQVQTVTTLTVPNLMCGAIIGKAGANVRQIRMSSGVTRIDFSQNESGDITSDRTITITGTQDQVQIAEQLMAQFVQNSTNVNQSN